MKRIICLITALCLVLGSFSFCFGVDWSSTDQQNLANAAGRLYYMNQSAAYYLYNIAANTQNTYNKLQDIYNALFYGNHNITYWVNSISSYMSPIYNAISNMPTDLSIIQGLLGYPTSNDSGTTWNSYIRLITPDGLGVKYLSTPIWTGSGWTFGSTPTDWYTGMQFGINKIIEMNGYSDNYLWPNLFTGNTTTQSYTNPLTLQSATFTPTSTTNGLYTWLSKIQEPAARLSYVLASPERIAAQEAAAANEEAVVDNFIDSSGNGSASPSDIGSISDISSGYKSNFGSDASVTGIFNIFNSNNMGWFSQETANQLDTTANTRRGSSFNTPLLDQQINDIYDQIGVKHD